MTDQSVALISAGASGIGLACARALAEMGHRVLTLDIDAEAVARFQDEFGEGSAVVCDVADASQVEATFHSLVDPYQGVDLLFNNAGIAGGNYKTWEYPVEEFRRVIDVDLNAVFICCRAVVPHMRERGYGRIINTASIAGKEGNPNASAYSAAKAGVIGLTKSLGKELAPDGICVNCFTPAVIQTDILKQITQQHIDYMLSKIPMGRFGEVEEAGALVAWLASEDCSFTTGGVFDLSGGRATY